MVHEARHRILTRLASALATIGAVDAIRRLELLTPSLLDQDVERLESLVKWHCCEFCLDSAWILTGQRGMSDDPVVPERTPVFAMFSVHPRNGRWRRKEVEHIALPPEVLARTRFVTRMESRVLEPRIRQGAYLVVDTDLDAIPETSDPDAVFAVDVLGEGLVVRLARYDRNAGRLELTGLEPGVPPCSIPYGAPDSRVIGRVVWVAQML
jgi:hypothetical protein